MKTIIREIIAMIILIAAILLIVFTIFFDYIKDNSIKVSSAGYTLSAEEKAILEEKKQYMESQNALVLSSGYKIDEDDLQYYKSNGNLVQGQSSPFDETPVTEILHSSDGSTYYDISNRVRGVDPSTYGTISGDYYEYVNSLKSQHSQQPQQTQQNNQINEPNEFTNDISAPSVESGSIIPSTGK